jgi:Secretion system C-terminal sorting domain/Pregnancy-associated plasma protein-A
MSQIKTRHPLSISVKISQLLCSYSNNRIGVILCLLFVLNVPLIAQKVSGADRLKLPTTPRRYHTQKNYQRLLTLDKEMASRRNFMEFGSFHSTISDLPKEVAIPVVVHVLYKAGSDTKLLPTESDIKKQLNESSKDFRQTVKIEKHEADTKEKFSNKNALDTKISFCLASKDPAGRVTSGVLTVPTSVTSWLADDKMKSASTGGSTAWDTEKYLNIWVVNMPDSISAYAQYPGGPALTDGIVIDYRYFGTKNKTDKKFPYTDGKTLTHLIGNYFNLNDLWSETMLCGDDGVEDTPIHNAPTLGFVDYRYVSTCDGNPVVMSMNYMDNTNDECLYMFTTGQKRRMIVCLLENGSRYKLAQSGATQCGSVQALQAPPNVVNTTPTVKFYEPLTCRIYPNPAENMITFDIGLAKEGETELIVSNTLGNVVLTKKLKLNEGSQQVPINCSQWAVGLYFVIIKANDQTLTERIVINH